MTSRFLEIRRTPRALLDHRRFHHFTTGCPAAHASPQRRMMQVVRVRASTHYESHPIKRVRKSPLTFKRLYFRVRRKHALIIFTLALAVSGLFISVVAFNAVLAQARPQAPIVEPPTTKGVPAVSRTPSEKTMDKLDKQLGKKLNICRGC
jgi:hypothetical protein